MNTDHSIKAAYQWASSHNRSPSLEDIQLEPEDDPQRLSLFRRQFTGTTISSTSLSGCDVCSVGDKVLLLSPTKSLNPGVHLSGSFNKFTMDETVATWV